MTELIPPEELLNRLRESLLPGVPADHVFQRLQKGDGNELRSKKFFSPESSAALAVNCFGWFVERPGCFPTLPGTENAGAAEMVDVEFKARFPWSGGRHPQLDAVVQTESTLIGIESKRFEPFRDEKKVSLSEAYNRPVWGANMTQYEKMRDQLKDGRVVFKYLDAPQLVKHAFGLVTEARKRNLKAVLYYIFCEPGFRAGQRVSKNCIISHRAEISEFAQRVEGDEVAFHAISYRDWISTWREEDRALKEHGRMIIDTFQP